MPLLVLHCLSLFTFPNVKNHLSKVLPASGNTSCKSEHHKYDHVNKRNIIKCGCCAWKGKRTETKKKFIFLNRISEMELYCPKCNKYLGFLSEKQ